MNERETLLYNALAGAHSLSRAPKADIARDLIGLQAQFARNPQYSLWLRASDYAPENWDEGLVKIWSHRGAMHAVPEEELGLHLSARGYSFDTPYEEGRWGLTAAVQRRWAPFLSEQALLGNDSRDGLKAACLAAGMDEATLGRVFYGWGGLIQEMTLRGRLVCQTGTAKRYAVPRPPRFMEPEDARRVLMRRYFAAFGPATAADCANFFHYKSESLKPLLREITKDMLATEIGGAVYYHARPLIRDGELPECVLLPGFDQMVLAYKDRARFIAPENARKVVNGSGIVFPLAVVRGMARARWRCEGGRASVTPFERLLKKDEAAIRRAFRREMGLRDVSIDPPETAANA